MKWTVGTLVTFLMCNIKIQTENSRENTNATPALHIGNAPARRASTGVHNKWSVLYPKFTFIHIWLSVLSSFMLGKHLGHFYRRNFMKEFDHSVYWPISVPQKIRAYYQPLEEKNYYVSRWGPKDRCVADRHRGVHLFVAPCLL